MVVAEGYVRGRGAFWRWMELAGRYGKFLVVNRAPPKREPSDRGHVIRAAHCQGISDGKEINPPTQMTKKGNVIVENHSHK